MLKTKLGQLRALAFAEGISLLLIFAVSMPLKYLYDMPGPNKVIGMIHGVLFIGYCYWLWEVAQEKGWSWATKIWGFIASFIPFGTFIADEKIFKKAQDPKTN